MTLHIIYSSLIVCVCGGAAIHGSLIASPMMPNDTAVVGGDNINNMQNPLPICVSRGDGGLGGGGEYV